MTQAWPFASGVPTVNCCEAGAGGLQAGCASGGPCVRFGAAQAAYAGTSDARSGDAPAGRGYPARSAPAYVMRRTW